MIEDPISRITDYSPNVVDDIFTRPGSSVDSLKELIRDIEEQIESRLELNKVIISSLEKQEVEVSNFVASMPLSSEPHSTKEQMLLFKSKAIELAESRRREELECWKDIARLKEELRKYKRELQEKESRMNLLDNILK